MKFSYLVLLSVLATIRKINKIEILSLQIFIFINIYQSENSLIILFRFFFVFAKEKHPAFSYFFENYNYNNIAINFAIFNYIIINIYMYICNQL